MSASLIDLVVDVNDLDRHCDSDAKGRNTLIYDGDLPSHALRLWQLSDSPFPTFASGPSSLRPVTTARPSPHVARERATLRANLLGPAFCAAGAAGHRRSGLSTSVECSSNTSQSPLSSVPKLGGLRELSSTFQHGPRITLANLPV